MEYRTGDGVRFDVLPEGARCTYTRKHPDNMDSCPTCNFDDFGNVCVPDVCGYYHEYIKRKPFYGKSSIIEE